ncbi:hypothetical protein NBRC116602_29210 [Hyphomicrobiales bacterium 4NK60-0047b]
MADETSTDRLSKAPSYRVLYADSIIKTLIRLEKRIDDRFRDRGIQEICLGLIDISRTVKTKSLALNKPHWMLRFFVGLILLLGTLVFIYVGTLINFSKFSTEAGSFVQMVEQGVNSIMLIGLGLVFLISTETRLKRRQALKDLHELRSIVHVIDMHQLTKDPSVFLADRTSTPNSPKQDLNQFEMVRYLDYCSEMLSLTAKLAALYSQNMEDPIVVNAVNDVEILALTLSRKIWQKIAILEQNH